MRLDIAIALGALTIGSCRPAWAQRPTLALQNPQWFEIEGSNGHYINDADITGFGGYQTGYREFELITPSGDYARLRGDCVVWDVADVRYGKFVGDNTIQYTDVEPNEFGAFEYRSSSEFEQAVVQYACEYEDNRVSGEAITSSIAILGEQRESPKDIQDVARVADGNEPGQIATDTSNEQSPEDQDLQLTISNEEEFTAQDNVQQTDVSSSGGSSFSEYEYVEVNWPHSPHTTALFAEQDILRTLDVNCRRLGCAFSDGLETIEERLFRNRRPYYNSLAEEIIVESNYLARCFDEQGQHIGAYKLHFGGFKRYYVYSIDIAWNTDSSNQLDYASETWLTVCTTPPDEAINRLASGDINQISGDVRDVLPNSDDIEVAENRCEQYSTNPTDQAQYFLEQACLSLEQGDLSKAAEHITNAFRAAEAIDALQSYEHADDLSVLWSGKANNSLNQATSLLRQKADLNYGPREEEIINETASLLVGFIPFVGTAYDWANAITGVDQITKKELATWERVLSLVPYGRRAANLTQAAVEKVGAVASGVRRRLSEVARDESGSVPVIPGRNQGRRNDGQTGNIGVQIGIRREQKVAELTGGRVSNESITVQGIGSTDIDVIGPNGELIEVGGPAKAGNLGNFGRQLNVLKAEADQRNVRAMVYLQRGTPESAVRVAQRRLGAENVIIFDLSD